MTIIYGQTGYFISDKHVRAQKKLAEILHHYFRRIFVEFDAPVPNPYRIYGDMKARSTIPYDLDIFAEDPRWEKIDTLKHQKIAIEIDCKKGHNDTKYQHYRDERRSKQIADYYGIPIYRYSCHEVVGAGWFDRKYKRHPIHDETEYFDWWGIVSKKLYHNGTETA